MSVHMALTTTGRPLTVFEPPSLRSTHPLAALRRLSHFADLFRTLSAHRVRVRYKQSRLGIVWAMLQPLAMMLVFALMFSLMGAAPSEGVPYPLFAYAGLLLWSSFSGGVASAATAMTSHATLLTKVYFPREILPLTYVTAAIIDLALASIALAALMVWYGVGVAPVAAWGAVSLALLTALLAAMGLLLSALQVRYRDVGIAMPVLLQMWMFASPVLYPLALVKANLPPHLYTLYVMNPMAGVVDGFRRSVVLQQPPDLFALGVGAGVIAALLPAAYVYFKHAERTMADVV
jgi:lipopolysaccharide transport system permease protein